jgi:hypothetical protein
LSKKAWQACCWVGFDLDYPPAARIATRIATDLRTLDRALWQYFREHQPSNVEATAV